MSSQASYTTTEPTPVTQLLSSSSSQRQTLSGLGSREPAGGGARPDGEEWPHRPRVRVLQQHHVGAARRRGGLGEVTVREHDAERLAQRPEDEARAHDPGEDRRLVRDSHRVCARDGHGSGDQPRKGAPALRAGGPVQQASGGRAARRVLRVGLEAGPFSDPSPLPASRATASAASAQPAPSASAASAPARRAASRPAGEARCRRRWCRYKHVDRGGAYLGVAVRPQRALRAELDHDLARVRGERPRGAARVGHPREDRGLVAVGHEQVDAPDPFEERGRTRALERRGARRIDGHAKAGGARGGEQRARRGARARVQQRVSGQVQVRRVLGQRTACSLASASASGSIECCSPGSTSTTQVPVGRAGSIASRASTPSARSARTASRPGPSSPTLPIRVAVAPARASHTATFAPAPPPRSVTRAGVSEPCATGPESEATTSVITSPTTTIRPPLILRPARSAPPAPRCAARA